MWVVLYGGVYDGIAVLVDKKTLVVKVPKNFDLKRDIESVDFTEGEYEYERTEAEAVGWNVSGSKQQGVAFTPRKLEPMGG